MNIHRPTNITLNQAAETLVIEWDGKREGHYPLGPLRMACPCAECRGGHDKMGREFDPEDLLALEPDRHYEAEKIELVGNYALQIIWNDGHRAGIYTWDYLYRLCPAEDSND
jgi:DUF971 family protein